MSKETPEIGDVWENKETGLRCFIYIVSKNYIYVIDEEYDVDYFSKESFLSGYTHAYIGKAKGSIKDLFEVEDENS